ncbi:MAG: gamma-glutamyl-gamma-aminobutyrate hydrolase family protein [Pseudomonadota bacterium]
MAQPVIIGVTGPSTGIPWAWWATRSQLRRAGARAVRLHAGIDFKEFGVAGLVIGGGNDIDPAVYGGDVSDDRSVDPERDAYELSVLEFADDEDIPVLGICRGSQLINVHRGGNLIGDISGIRVHTSNRATLLPRKKVRIVEDSVLSKLIGSTEARVNSLHHQAVNASGCDLRVVACDWDDIVQGIESTAGPWRVGVQWHPEYMPQRRDQRRLFSGFVDVCRG